MDVDAAEAVCMSEDRNAGVFFDVSDQLVGATRYDKVDVFVEIKE